MLETGGERLLLNAMLWSDASDKPINYIFMHKSLHSLDQVSCSQ